MRCMEATDGTATRSELESDCHLDRNILIFIVSEQIVVEEEPATSKESSDGTHSDQNIESSHYTWTIRIKLVNQVDNY